jgi:hypothetical protein
MPHSTGRLSASASSHHSLSSAAFITNIAESDFRHAQVLARRLDGANQALIDLKSQLQAGQPRSMIGKTIEKIEGLLGPSGASLAYAGYPYDPYA